MPLGQASRNPITVDYFSLVTPDDMRACLETILAINFHGTLTAGKDPVTQETKWLLQVSGPQPLNQQLMANQSDVLVWDSNASVMSVETATSFAASYTIQS